MKKLYTLLLLLGCILLGTTGQAFGQSELGYLNSQLILNKYKEAQDIRKQLEAINKEWEKEALDMQREIQALGEKLETQALLLSEDKKIEEQQRIQVLIQKLQAFQQEKWGPQGQALKEEAKLLQPVQKKIMDAINKVGQADGYIYIFDTVTANIVYADKNQVDLTERVLEELEKGVADSKKSQ